MPVEIHVHDDFVEFIVNDLFRGPEIMNMATEVHSTHRKRGALLNFSRVSLSDLKAVNLRDFAEKSAELAPFRGADARNALLVRLASEIPLMRAYTGFTDALSPVKHEIFMDRDKAIAWLTEKD